MRIWRKWRIIWIGRSTPAMTSSPAAITNSKVTNWAPSVPAAPWISSAISPSELSVSDHSIQPPMLPSRITLSSDLPSSIQPAEPNMRLRPEAGFSREAFGIIDLLFQPNEPSAAWLRIAPSMAIANRLPSGSRSCQPAASKGRSGSKCSTSPRPNEKLAVITPLQAAIRPEPKNAIQAQPSRITSAVPKSFDLSNWPSSTALRLRLGVGASVFSPAVSAISRTPGRARYRARCG
jgi:hypothetical protein